MEFARRHLAECGSTNTEALAHLRDGGGPLLLSASRQTAGRGRLGRAWQSDDAALTFSVALPLPAELELSGLSLAVGCAVADVLDPSAGRIRLKWPNDLFLDGAKLGGILIETVPLPAQQRGVVIGIGLNLQPLPPDADRSAYASGHAALATLHPAATAATTLDRLAPALRAMLADFQTLGFAPWHAAFVRRDLAAGRPVRVGEQPGIARGVTATGELLLETAEGLRTVSAGELSLKLETSA
ncbi:biotin--[acetyl-CoA-carboxylase] ligase [Pelomonas cellulosilytica]|uniref:biotin--[biotin carboxyl-carrier protein] ligase n=1 Tax=Pelomonas cellulosilytica TaxID=2906762 RepID=A0ABS8Y337_9BURK|nr:biotin--[acetyl-CoA-carboxylase] ligase [Pelomonas sp. P8]MCE4557421.1 biotin--[acetyl-CoA-carboxylase] ligase [Pelomonas sp. P8]